MLSINNLCYLIDGQAILQSCNLTVKAGTIHALTGSNGSGKTTLAQTIAGAPTNAITTGIIHLHGKEITTLSANKRAQQGLFLSFQLPPSIPGLSIGTLLRQSMAIHGHEIASPQWQTRLHQYLELLALENDFLERPLDSTLSGGERKKIELLQLLLRRPALAILDEIDTGLDQETITKLALALRQIRKNDPTRATLVITHQEKFLELLAPDSISTMQNGTIVTTTACQYITTPMQPGTCP